MAADFQSQQADPTLFESRAAQVIGSCVVFLILPTMAVALRLLSRWTAGVGLWWDDYTIILAMILSWGPCIVCLYGVHIGFGKHIETLPADTVFDLFKILYAAEFLYNLALTSVKFSILSFLYRIFPIVQFRRGIVFLHVFLVALSISCVTVSIFQCTPIHAFWSTLAGYFPVEKGARCVNVIQYFIATGAISAATDFVILAMPIPIVWRLRTGKTQKLILTAIFTAGLAVCAVAVVRIVQLVRLDETSLDVTWNYVPTGIWTAAESSVAVVSACLPSLRPLFVRLLWGGAYKPKPTSYSTSRGLSYSWRSGSSRKDVEGSFDRLQDLPAKSSWRNKVNIKGGQSTGVEEHDLGSNEHEMPTQGIRARTTVEVTTSERIDWQDTLF